MAQGRSRGSGSRCRQPRGATTGERRRTAYDGIPLLCFTLDRAGTVLSLNSRALEELGYQPHELVGRPLLALFHPEDRELAGEHLRAAARGAGHGEGVELRIVRKGGGPFWVRQTVQTIRGAGSEPLVLVVCENLTESRRSGADLDEARHRLRALASELALIEERERRRITRGLHDQVGQVLGVARVKLGEALAAGPSADVARKVAEGRRLVDRAIRETRALTFELSSPVLYELGLEAALEGLAERALERHGIPCRFEADPAPRPLAENVAVTLYSIARELLWNVVKHAGASELGLAIRRNGDGLRITVSDDGAGFDAAEAVAPPTEDGGFGLFSARERLEHLGGSLEIDSAPGRGTRIVVTCPLAAAGQREGAK